MRQIALLTSWRPGRRYHLAPVLPPLDPQRDSPRLIESHYENNYGGALNRLNAISEELGSLDPATTPTDVLSRLKRDETAAQSLHAVRQ